MPCSAELPRIRPWSVRRPRDSPTSTPGCGTSSSIRTRSSTPKAPSCYISSPSSLTRPSTSPSSRPSAAAPIATPRSPPRWTVRPTPSAIRWPFLESVRFIERSEDALRTRRPTYTIAEPVIRWHQLVIAPNEAPWPSAPPSASGTPPHPRSRARSTDRTSRPSPETGPSRTLPRTPSADNPPRSGPPPSPAAGIAPATRSMSSPTRRNPSPATAYWPSARRNPPQNPSATGSWTVSNTFEVFCRPTRTAAAPGCFCSAAPDSPPGREAAVSVRPAHRPGAAAGRAVR